MGPIKKLTEANVGGVYLCDYVDKEWKTSARIFRVQSVGEDRIVALDLEKQAIRTFRNDGATNISYLAEPHHEVVIASSVLAKSTLASLTEKQIENIYKQINPKAERVGAFQIRTGDWVIYYNRESKATFLVTKTKVGLELAFHTQDGSGDIKKSTLTLPYVGSDNLLPQIDFKVDVKPGDTAALNSIVKFAESLIGMAKGVQV